MHPVIYLEDRPHHSTVCEIWGTWPGSIHDFKEQGLSHLLDAAMAIRQRHRDELATFRIQSRHSK